MAAGNKHLGYKAALNAIEERSPGSKAAFYLGFLDRMAPLLADHAAIDRDRARPLPRPAARRRPARCARSAGSSSRRRATSRSRSSSSAAGVGGDRRSRYGEKVLILDAKERRYLVTLKEGGEFHTHAGFVPHAELIGQTEGIVVKANRARRTPCCARRSRTSSSRCRVARR